MFTFSVGALVVLSVCFVVVFVVETVSFSFCFSVVFSGCFVDFLSYSCVVVFFSVSVVPVVSVVFVLSVVFVSSGCCCFSVDFTIEVVVEKSSPGFAVFVVVVAVVFTSVDFFSVGRSVGRLVGRLVGGLVGGSVGRS